MKTLNNVYVWCGVGEQKEPAVFELIGFNPIETFGNLKTLMGADDITIEGDSGKVEHSAKLSDRNTTNGIWLHYEEPIKRKDFFERIRNYQEKWHEEHVGMVEIFTSKILSQTGFETGIKKGTDGREFVKSVLGKYGGEFEAFKRGYSGDSSRGIGIGPMSYYLMGSVLAQKR